MAENQPRSKLQPQWPTHLYEDAQKYPITEQDLIKLQCLLQNDKLDWKAIKKRFPRVPQQTLVYWYHSDLLAFGWVSNVSERLDEAEKEVEMLDRKVGWSEGITRLKKSDLWAENSKEPKRQSLAKKQLSSLWKGKLDESRRWQVIREKTKKDMRAIEEREEQEGEDLPGDLEMLDTTAGAAEDNAMKCDHFDSQHTELMDTQVRADNGPIRTRSGRILN